MSQSSLNPQRHGRGNSGRDGQDRSISSFTRPRRKSINGNDAYLYALRVAYLAYLLQPRQKRVKTVQRPQVNRATTSVSLHDVIGEFASASTSKSHKFPLEFLKVLDRRIYAIMLQEDKRPEYLNVDVRRSFSIFKVQLADPTFRRQIEIDKRAEDLILKFFTKTTQELSKGKPPHDDGVKRMVDRHVALFVRLMSSILKEKGWDLDRRDLAVRLNDLEKKLLKHEEDLAAPSNTGSLTTETIMEEIPLSHKAEDMPLVLVVARIFGLRNTVVQSDIDKHRTEWTEAAALKDLKTYQAHLTVGTGRTLSETDFDTKEAYEEWKRSEVPELSKMILFLIQHNPSLAASSTSSQLPQLNQRASILDNGTYAELSKALSPTSEKDNVFEMPDLNGLHLNENGEQNGHVETVYTFIPADVRGMFRFIAKTALVWDLSDSPHDSDTTASATKLLSNQSTDLLNEISLRWRIPKFSRIVLFLDCVREKFSDQTLTLEQLDAAFNYAKEPVAEENNPKARRQSLVLTSIQTDRLNWTIPDFSLMQQVLSSIHETLLRDLYAAMMTTYDDKQSPQLGMVLMVIDEHIRADPMFRRSTSDIENFHSQVVQGLTARAREIYAEYIESTLPQNSSDWEFYHIMQLEKKVLAQAQKIQKRYRKNPEIVGVDPLGIMLVTMLPSFAEDSKAAVESVLQTNAAEGRDLPILDGFELYKELASFRRIFGDALPSHQFPYKPEDLLQSFVWRWVQATEGEVMGWVEQAIKHDPFTVRSTDKTIAPTQEERHSNSILDVFRSFNQVVQQLIQLEWADELMLSKFMTALSKALSAGISRYCEIVENMFNEKMDRLSPEQELEAKFTRQERLMKYAKDTWNNETRVQPFQFCPESFVMLNDISFGIEQWDKLESEINVDACADVIRRNTPPALQRDRTITNYVFTIKIVEAENLKAMDVSGWSDPYVVLTDEFQKRLFKSKVIYRNLNPRWEESVDISTTGPINLISTVWDWDAVGAHDYVGRTMHKLDPVHFLDFLPREYWLNLDTQGRILIRVSMDGERDDIQFYFGKAFRSLQRAQRGMTRTITDKLSAYIAHCLSRKVLRSLTSKSVASTVTSLLGSYRNRAPPPPSTVSEADIHAALQPLYTYFDDNFFIMNQTLTSASMLAVMTRLWKEVLSQIENLLVPPLSDRPTSQVPLTQSELDIAFKWLQSLLEFFNAVDPETGIANGVQLSVLKTTKYHELKSLAFFYTNSTQDLIRESERIASQSAQYQSQQRSSRMSAPANLNSNASLLAPGATVPLRGARRAKTIMDRRNLGTMRRAKEAKREAAQAEASDDMILRILRMRPEALKYLQDRNRQKERLAAQMAADMIVRQSLAQGMGGGRMTGPSVIRR